MMEIKVKRLEDVTFKQVNFLLCCPICEIKLHKTFHISEKATEEEIQEFIQGERQLFYYNHYLNH